MKTGIILESNIGGVHVDVCPKCYALVYDTIKHEMDAHQPQQGEKPAPEEPKSGWQTERPTEGPYLVATEWNGRKSYHLYEGKALQADVAFYPVPPYWKEEEDDT